MTMTPSEIAHQALEYQPEISQDEGSDHAELDTTRSEALHQEFLSLKSTTTFREDVRNEWIQAVFGTDFPACAQTSTKPYQGMGLARIAPYMAYNVTIPICSTSQDTIMGISISRLSLGLYVRHVTPGSEAWCAGIIPNSVLVAINGMSLLAEPSKQALERLWQYEGHLQVPQGNPPSSPSTPAPQATHGGPTPGSKLVPEELSLSNRQPLHMTLIYQGRLYSSLFLSNPPYGIDWAPCGNFALVKRSYNYAQEAGVFKGSIIASINATKDFHELDHTLAATTLRNLFVNRKEIHITLCIPPSEARSGHFERIMDAKELHLSPTPSSSKPMVPSKTQRQQVMAELDGVEIRVHPILFSACSPRSNNIVSNAAMNLSQLAFRVAAGELFSFPQRGKYQYYFSQRYYRSCPPINQPLSELLSRNDALLYLLEYYSVHYDETKLAMGRFINMDANSVVLSFLKERSPQQLNPLLQTFLLQILAVMRLDVTQNGPTPLSQFLLYACKNDVDLCHRMEFMAQAQGLTYLKDQMTKLRKQRQHNQQRREPRPIPIRVESAPQDSPVASASIVTGTTASVITTASSSLFSGKRVEEAPPAPAPTKRFFGFFRKKKQWNHRKKRSPASVDQQPKVHHTTHVVNGMEKRGVHNKQPDGAAPHLPRSRATETSLSKLHKDVLFANTLSFLEELEAVCLDVEKSLLRSFSQKIAGWALTPWSASKETELAQVTQVMRERLQRFPSIPLLNPIDSDTLVAVDAQGSYILPSAHFPLLLTFDCQDPVGTSSGSRHERLAKARSHQIFGKEIMYRTKVELVALVEKKAQPDQATGGNYTVHGAVGGTIMKSGPSIPTNRSTDRHAWDHGNVLTFDFRSSWGAPNTLSLLLSQSTDTIVASDENGRLLYEKDIGVCFVNLASVWERLGTHNGNKTTESFQLKKWSRNGIYQFDQNGDVNRDTYDDVDEGLELQIRITLQKVQLSSGMNGEPRARKCSLLYKHDDDMLQELFAIEFVKSCDRILKSCGLDLRLLTFSCIPVGRRRGFIEWIQGAVPISEICQPFAGSILDGNKKDLGRPSSMNGNFDQNSLSNEDPKSSVAKAGLTKYESLWRLTNGQDRRKKAQANGGSLRTNLIQDFLRSFHYSSTDPYFIRKDVLDTFVKSCAGYCVITYILGVGDRHLDNLLLHPTGHFFHCDYSFILGHDPKKYLPLRITEDMVNGMGGRESDNYAKFLSLTCASFLTFRRPENVRHLMSFVRLMDGCSTDSASADSKLSVETTMMGIRERLLLDISDEEAISFMENLVDESCSSRMWMAVDAIHSLGKRF